MDMDPKEEARKSRKTPEVERLLRQFSNVDGPKGATAEYKKGWARAFGKKTGEHAGKPQAGAETCEDGHCWCRRSE